jgi:hypothetical protein
MKFFVRLLNPTTLVEAGQTRFQVALVGPQGAPGALDADTPVDRLGFIDRTTQSTIYIFFDKGQMGKES